MPDAMAAPESDGSGDAEATGDADAGVLSIVRDIQRHLRSLDSKYDNLMRSITFCSDKVTDFERSLKELTKKTIEIGK